MERVESSPVQSSRVVLELHSGKAPFVFQMLSRFAIGKWWSLCVITMLHYLHCKPVQKGAFPLSICHQFFLKNITQLFSEGNQNVSNDGYKHQCESPPPVPLWLMNELWGNQIGSQTSGLAGWGAVLRTGLQWQSGASDSACLQHACCYPRTTYVSLSQALLRVWLLSHEAGSLSRCMPLCASH